MNNLRAAIFRRRHLDVSLILAEIDSQIAKLQQARDIISGTTSAPAPVKTGAKRGRPKGSKNASSKATASIAPAKATSPSKSKRKLSPEGRKAIADAMKKRWAERRKVTTK
jgi:hypothetical protein